MGTPSGRPGRSILAAVAFLVSFSLLLLVVFYRFLIPAISAAAATTLPAHRRELRALSTLMLALLLVALVLGLILTFPLARMLFPRRTSPRARTQYPDAWTESARRLKLPEEDQRTEDV
jgi:O-antigen/teichoic acid export membrane protein